MLSHSFLLRIGASRQKMAGNGVQLGSQLAMSGIEEVDA